MSEIRKMCYNLYAGRVIYTVSSLGLLITINYCFNNICLFFFCLLIKNEFGFTNILFWSRSYDSLSLY